MPPTTVAIRTVALMLTLCLTGCQSSLTGQLWTSDRFHHVVRPVSGAEVEMFYSQQRKDYLLSYESDERFSAHRRQIYLGENVERLENQRKPRYASAARAELQPVPVNRGTNVLPAAVITDRLIVHTEQGEVGPFPLPAYDDGGETVLQVMLTPFTVVADLALVGFVIGAVFMSGSCVNCSR